LNISNKAKEAIDAVKKQMAEEKKEREIGAKEIEKIIKERDAELAKLQDKATAKATESEAKKQKFIQKLEAERTVETLAQIGKVTTAFEQQLTNRQALQDSARQYEISQTERQIDTQKTLAEKGLANELAFQEEKRNKQELASRDAQEKQQRQKQAIDLANNFNSFLQARLKQTPPPNEGQAIAGALSDTLLAQGIAKGLVQFAAEGNNMIQGAGTETSDSIPFMLSKNEAVIKASENKKHNDAVVALNAGVFDKLFVPKYEVENVATKLSSNTASNIGDSLLLQSNQEVIKLLKEIKEKPTQHIDIDKLGNFVETVYEKGAKNTTIHKPKIRLR
jgi:hypothetical protein